MSSNAGVNIWFAGAFAGVSVNLLVFPLDTLKTRLQSPKYKQIYRQSGGIANRAAWRGLYQGVSTVMLVTVPSSGVFFTTYEGMKYVLGDSASSSGTHGYLSQPAIHALSSSIAQLMNCAVVTPFEVLKQNAQMLPGKPALAGSASEARKRTTSSPTLEVLRQLRRHPTSLWRGYTALAARDLPFTALQFPVFEYIRKVLISRESRLKGSDVKMFEWASISAFSAGLSGSAAAWVTTPFDVIKTRMMLEAGMQNSRGAEGRLDKRPPGSDGRYGQQVRKRNGFHISKDVFEKEGLRGLFRGGAIRTVFTFFGNGLFMGFYEGAKFHLRSYEKA